MALECIAEPVLEPVTLAELKEMLRVDAGDTSQDGVLMSLNVAARTWVETLSKRRCVQQTWRLLMDFFPGYIDMKIAGQNVSSPFVSGSNAVLVGLRYAFLLPYPPVQSLELFQYQDANGNVTAMTEGVDFIADLASEPARLTPPYSKIWPVARVVANAVQVDYVAGYATPITLSTQAAQRSIAQASPPDYVFSAADVGRAVSIPGAGAGGGTLNSTIASVESAASATLRDAAVTAVGGAFGLIVNHGKPGHWDLIKTWIKFLVNTWFVYRIPKFDPELRDMVLAGLAPVRDLRV